jgi:hypothetical protein
LVTSRENLANATGLSVQQVRSALTRLKSTGLATYRTTQRFTVVTLTNWDAEQGDEAQQQPDHQPDQQPPINPKPTRQQPEANPKPTTTKESNHQSGNHVTREEEQRLDQAPLLAKSSEKTDLGGGVVVPQTDQAAELHRTLTEYMGEEPPVEKLHAVLGALGTHQVGRFCSYLRGMDTKYQRGGKAGPNTWGWFVSTARNYAGDKGLINSTEDTCWHGKPVGVCCNPSDEFAAMTEALG